jgi:RNA polymerase sigma factor (sigma-70 family)
MTTTRTENEALYQACCNAGSVAQHDAFATLWRLLYPIASAMLRARPDAEALAADCTQTALIKIHRSLAQCREPATFTSWAAQIARRAVLDALRQPALTRQVPLPSGPAEPMAPAPAADEDVRITLLAAIEHGPLSERSRRVVLGRFFAERTDEALAAVETQLAGEVVLPSHIQVTRAKNLAKLRQDAALVARLRDLVME